MPAYTTLPVPPRICRLRDLTTTFMELGGQELQINVVDEDTLAPRRRTQRPTPT